MSSKTLFICKIYVLICFIGWSCTDDPDKNPIEDAISDSEILPNINLANIYINVDQDIAYDYRIYGYILQTDDEPSSAQENFIDIQPLNNNNLGYTDGLALVAGSIIDSIAMTWTSNTLTIARLSMIDNGYEIPEWESSFTESINNFLAIRQLSDSQFNYGWIQIYIDKETGHLTIQEYSVNPVPDSSIVAGQ